jgi:hypothetical protein
MTTLSSITTLVARTGRHQQRYEDGYRLVAGYAHVYFHVTFSVIDMFGVSTRVFFSLSMFAYNLAVDYMNSYVLKIIMLISY